MSDFDIGLLIFLFWKKLLSDPASTFIPFFGRQQVTESLIHQKIACYCHVMLCRGVRSAGMYEGVVPSGGENDGREGKK